MKSKTLRVECMIVFKQANLSTLFWPLFVGLKCLVNAGAKRQLHLQINIFLDLES